VLIALSIVAAFRRHRTAKAGNTQQNKSIGYYGDHL
jgi:hypothetical protein